MSYVYSGNPLFLAGYEKLFSRVPNHIITINHKRNIRGLTVEECARRCLQEMTFNCRGFDYETRRRNCWLTDKGLEDAEGLKKRPNTDFYGRKTSNIYNKIRTRKNNAFGRCSKVQQNIACAFPCFVSNSVLHAFRSGIMSFALYMRL